MDEKLYRCREVVKSLLNGRELEIPVISQHPEHQKHYRALRAQGHTHAEAETIADDLWQTRWYEEFVVVADRNGAFIRIPVYSKDKKIQAAYQYLRQMGESHNSADMTITRQGPRIGLCDTTLLRTPIMHGNQFLRNPQGGEIARKKAEAAGVSTTGKFYHPGIATELYDPEAWVGSISDIQDVCKRRGWNFKYQDGEMKIQATADFSQDIPKQYRAKKRKKKVAA